MKNTDLSKVKRSSLDNNLREFIQKKRLEKLAKDAFYKRLHLKDSERIKLGIKAITWGF